MNLGFVQSFIPPLLKLTFLSALFNFAAMKAKPLSLQEKLWIQRMGNPYAVLALTEDSYEEDCKNASSEPNAFQEDECSQLLTSIDYLH
jgi:hypothetical protein